MQNTTHFRDKIIGINLSEKEKEQFLEILEDEEAIFVEAKKDESFKDTHNSDLYLIIIPWRSWKRLSKDSKKARTFQIKTIDSSFIGNSDILSECIVAVSSDILDKNDEIKKIINNAKGLNNFISDLKKENELFRELYFRKITQLEFLDELFKNIAPLNEIPLILEKGCSTIKKYFDVKDICVLIHRKNRIEGYKTNISDRLWKNYIVNRLRIEEDKLYLNTICASNHSFNPKEVIDISPSHEGFKIFFVPGNTPLGEDEFSVLEMAIDHLSLLIQKAIEYEELELFAYMDFLTETGNRHYFDKTINQEIKRHNRLNSPLSFIMIDIDHFKKINDGYGHIAGDMVLKELAHIIKNNIREIDHVIRYGGEEFLIVLPHTDKKNAYILAERLRKSIEGHKFPIGNGKTLQVSVSMGVSEYNPQKGNSIKEVIEEADNALYLAKENGRNRVCVIN